MFESVRSNSHGSDQTVHMRSLNIVFAASILEQALEQMLYL